MKISRGRGTRECPTPEIRTFSLNIRGTFFPGYQYLDVQLANDINLGIESRLGMGLGSG